MALAYSNIISRYTNDSMKNWLTFLDLNFVKVENKYIYLITDEGERHISEFKSLLKIKEIDKPLVFCLMNDSGSFVTVSLRLLDSYVIEDYGLDQLINDNEYENIHKILLNRYETLYQKEIGIGIIFDRLGYSENYIQFSRI